MWLWWYVDKYASFEKSDDIGEGIGDGVAQPGAAVNANEDITLGCGDSCSGVGKEFYRTFDVFPVRVAVLNENGVQELK